MRKVADNAHALVELSGPPLAEVPGRRPEQRQRTRGRPRDQAVDAAVRGATIELLSEIGYARLTMDQVAARARVSKTSLYLRWPNKVAMVADALQHRARAVPEIPDTGSLPNDVRVFLSALMRSRNLASQALAAVSGEIASNAELRTAWHRGLAGELTGCMRVIVTRAVGRGELSSDSDLELLSQLPLLLLRNWRLEHGTDPDEEIVDRIVQQFYTRTDRVERPSTSC